MAVCSAFAAAGTGTGLATTEALAAIGAKPDWGMTRARFALSGAVTAFGHGSVMKPCCAAAALPTSSNATMARSVDECPTTQRL